MLLLSNDCNACSWEAISILEPVSPLHNYDRLIDRLNIFKRSTFSKGIHLVSAFLYTCNYSYKLIIYVIMMYIGHTYNFKCRFSVMAP